ncbi:MAG: GNAT family N-acetyltransferase [Thermomicrobiales bacterium]
MENEQSIPVESSPGAPADSLDLVIEEARARDVRAIAEIQRQSFPPRLAYGPTALLTLLFWPNVAFLVARDRATDRVLGCGIADRYKGNTRVMNLAIDPSSRRRGVGRAILKELDKAMPEGDMTLMVQEHNAGAQALYLSVGYLRAGLARDYYGANQHGIMMRKPRYPDHPTTTISV